MRRSRRAIEFILKKSRIPDFVNKIGTQKLGVKIMDEKEFLKML